MARFNYFRWLTCGSLNNIRRNLVIYCDREVIYIFYKLRFTGIYVIARIRPRRVSSRCKFRQLVATPLISG